MQEMQVPSLGGNIPWRRSWQPPPVFLPGEFHGQRSLVAYLGSIGLQRVRHDWSYWASTHEFLRTQANKRQINERIRIAFCNTVTRLEMSRDWQQVKNEKQCTFRRDEKASNPVDWQKNSKEKNSPHFTICEILLWGGKRKDYYINYRLKSQIYCINLAWILILTNQL